MEKAECPECLSEGPHHVFAGGQLLECLLCRAEFKNPGWKPLVLHRADSDAQWRQLLDELHVIISPPRPPRPARCKLTDMLTDQCAGACCRPDLKGVEPVQQVWMRVTEAAPTKPRPTIPAKVPADLVQGLFQAIGGKKLDVLDMVRELCEPARHREFYRRKKQHRYHLSISPPLITQLWNATAPSSSAEAGTSRPTSSRPAARLDAIDTAVRIETDAARWLRGLGHDDPKDAIACIRKLASLVPSLDRCHRRHAMRDEQGNVICCTAHKIETDLARWWTWARIATGWDLPAWQPDNTCPLCGVRGSLRVRLVEQLATCINDTCRETWDDTTIGLLADHIRIENHEDEEAS